MNPDDCDMGPRCADCNLLIHVCDCHHVLTMTLRDMRREWKRRIEEALVGEAGASGRDAADRTAGTVEHGNRKLHIDCEADGFSYFATEWVDGKLQCQEGRLDTDPKSLARTFAWLVGGSMPSASDAGSTP